MDKYGISKVKAIVEGGKERYHSVFEGLKQTSDADYVLIHDGARPFVNQEIIRRCMLEVPEYQACVVGMPVKDTIKVVNDRLIVDTPYRPHLYITQTPQVFKRQLYFEAVTFAEEHALDFTDDCQLIEAINCKVYMTEGDYINIKITTPEDIAIAEILLARQKEEA